MKLTFEEKKLLYTYGCADLELTRKRLCEIAGLTVDPDQNKLVLDLCRKLEDETLADWYDQMFYFIRFEMECYARMEKLAQDIERDEDWGPEMFEENEDKRCFSCAVCAQQAVDTIGQGNIQIVYGGFGAELFCQPNRF